MAKSNKKGSWDRVCSGWYRITMGTEYWLPKPPTEMEAVYAAKNLIYLPDGCNDLSKNNHDAWSMLIIDGPDELLGQEITWFNRTPSDASDVPIEVAEDIVQHYNLYGKTMEEPDINIFDINPGLLAHPDFNGGLGDIGPADPRLMQQLAAAGVQTNPNARMHTQAAHGMVTGTQEMQQLQEFFDAQSFGQPGQSGQMYDNRGWVTTGDSLAGGAPLRNPQEVNQHLGEKMQLPGGDGRQSTEGMHFADASQDEFFGVHPPSASMPWWVKAGGAIALLGGVAAAFSKPKR